MNLNLVTYINVNEMILNNYNFQNKAVNGVFIGCQNDFNFYRALKCISNWMSSEICKKCKIDNGKVHCFHLWTVSCEIL